MGATNPAICMGQYSGFGTPIIDTDAEQTLLAAATAVSCGPLNLTYTTESVVTFIIYFQQATVYVSSSGSTVRFFNNEYRMGFFDRLNLAQRSYTETGLITGAMTYGGECISVAIAPGGSTLFQTNPNFLQYGFGY
jgi:hypothetical protein